MIDLAVFYCIKQNKGQRSHDGNLWYNTANKMKNK